MQVVFILVDINIIRGKLLVESNDLITFCLSLIVIISSLIGISFLEFILPPKHEIVKIEKQLKSNFHINKMDKYVNEYKEIVYTLKKEQWYLESELSLIDLSTYLNQSRTNISTIINNGGNITFYDLINSLRVEEMKKNLISNDSKYQNILEIAFKSGFNSKPTFQRAFKKITGKTPLQYKKEFIQV